MMLPPTAIPAQQAQPSPPSAPVAANLPSFAPLRQTAQAITGAFSARDVRNNTQASIARHTPALPIPTAAITLPAEATAPPLPTLSGGTGPSSLFIAQWLGQGIHDAEAFGLLLHYEETGAASAPLRQLPGQAAPAQTSGQLESQFRTALQEQQPQARQPHASATIATLPPPVAQTAQQSQERALSPAAQLVSTLLRAEQQATPRRERIAAAQPFRSLEKSFLVSRGSEGYAATSARNTLHLERVEAISQQA